MLATLTCAVSLSLSLSLSLFLFSLQLQPANLIAIPHHPMNPQYPFPPPPFTFNPSNPNPNPNPNFPFFPQPQFHSNSSLPPPPPPPPPLQNPVPDLPNSLSSLHNLITLTHSTLSSFSSVLPSSNPNPLIQCPFNPHHWVPPFSLFLHSLHCPSPLDIHPSTLQYPKTLKSEHQLIHQNKFVQPLNDPFTDLCFSLDDYVDFHSNFFYKDCPAVVSSLLDDATHDRIFSLPGSLSVECANFVTHFDTQVNRVQGHSVKVLPSEIWVVGCEVEQWNDYPNEYSYSVLRAFLCLEYVKECDLLNWVIVNSPRYGVVVDVPMSDHMLVLFRLCFKAMVREAAKSYPTRSNCHMNVKSSSFKCPVLVGVLKWLALQLSILYGETNAKLFVISLLKHWLQNAASYASLFPLGKQTEQDSSVMRDRVYEKSVENEGDVRDDKLFRKSIFVYQIAAAIAALHERSLLEERIKTLRNPRPLSAFQRNAEHAYLSKKANEERHKRHNYRALIEHDGLPSQKQHNLDTDKTKTREELLAEERDYKRRRMSYRGKKLKRTAKEVMRDIIEEYMDAIKQAGGIGCLTKGDGGSSSSQKASAHDTRNFKPNLHSTSDQHDGYRKLSCNDFKHKDAKFIDDSPSRNEHQKNDHYSQRHFEDQGTAHKDRYDRHYLSRSPVRDERHGRSRENRSHIRNSGVTEMYKDDRSKSHHSSDRSRHDRKLPHSTSISSHMSSGRKDKRKLEYTDGHRRQRSDDKSEFFRRGELNDRYDPSEASDIYEDEFEDSKYMRPEL